MLMMRCGNGILRTVILSEAKDLQFRSDANHCRFFASLRMTSCLTGPRCLLALRRPSLPLSLHVYLDDGRMDAGAAGRLYSN